MKVPFITAALCLFLAPQIHAAQATFSGTAPTVGPLDIANLTGSGAVGNNVSSGDPNATYLADDRIIQGQTFTTGNNPAGYQLRAITLRQVTYLTFSLIPDLTYTIRITTPVPSPPNRLAVIATETAFVPANAPLNFPTILGGDNQGPGSGRYITFTLANPVALSPNTTYGFDVGGGLTRHYWETDGTSGSPYAGGTAYSSGANGVGNTTRTPRTGDHVFIVALSTASAPVVSPPTISPSNTVYSGTIVTVSASAAGSQPLLYQWRQDTGSGPQPIPGANNTNLVVDTTGTFGMWIYDLVVTNSVGSSTSAPVTLTVLEANPPVVTTDTTPSSATRYEGQQVTFSAAFDGTQPISYQWRSFNGDVARATSTSLTLSNLQTSDAEEYWLEASNAVGTAQSTPALLTVLAAPAGPTPGTFAHAVRTNNPIAYWRLNDPVGTQFLYDSIGSQNQLNNNVTLAVPGLRAPAYPGFPSDNTAASFNGNSAATGGANLTGLTSFTVMSWFSPNGANGPFAGLLGQNDLLEVGYSDGSGINLWIQLNGIWTNPRTGTNGFEIGQWYFMAVVADGSSVAIYVNGVQRALAAGGTPSASSGFGFNIGGGGIFGASGDYFNGVIEDVVIFDRALSQQQIQDLFGVAVGLTAPSIGVQPKSQALYFGRTARFTASEIAGTAPLSYQWQRQGVNLSDGGNISGATTSSLTISNAGSGNVGNYRLIVSNASGAETSSVVSLTLVQPTGTQYETSAMALNPLAYWRLNETADPGGGGALAADYWGGLAGTYGSAALNGFNGINGPRPADGFSAFEAANKAAQFANGVANSYITVPPLRLNTNSVTVAMWLYPVGPQADYVGLLFTRSGTQGGLGYGGDFSGNRGQLLYTWNNNSTWVFQSGLMIPEGKWSFVAMAVEADKATLYLYYKDAGNDVLLSTNNVIPHISEGWSGNARIGGDPNGDGQTFNGIIDEVSVFNRALTAAQVLSLYHGNAGEVRLTLERPEPNLRLLWPQGTLQEALSPIGPWTNTPYVSPYEFTPLGSQKYYRVRVSP